MLKEILEQEVMEASDTKQLKSILDKIQALLIKAMKEDQKLGLDLPFDDINDQIGDINGNL